MVKILCRYQVLSAHPSFWHGMKNIPKTTLLYQASGVNSIKMEYICSITIYIMRYGNAHKNYAITTNKNILLQPNIRKCGISMPAYSILKINQSPTRSMAIYNTAFNE